MPFTYFVDYDRPRLPALTLAERIDYFEGRVRLVSINPLARILRTEVIVAGSSAILIFGVSMCCSIEACGKFLTGAKDKGLGANEKRFQSFLDKYLSRDYQTRKLGKLTYGEALWRHFRNGLAHGFTVCHGGFEGNPEDPYFSTRVIAGYNALEINPNTLFDDFTAGFGRYLADLRSAPASDPIAKNFNRVFEMVFVQGR